MSLNESIVEDAALTWFGELGYAIDHGPHIAPGEAATERDTFGDVVLTGRLREAIRRLNPTIPEEAREEALRKVLRVGTPSPTQTNRNFHAMLRDGVPVEYPRADGSIAGDHARLVDFEVAKSNDWLAVNQFTVIEGQHNRRPDIVVFVNGLPLAVIELKNAADEEATIWSAFNQLQTYKQQIGSLFHYNEVLVVSDGTSARIGSLTASQEWFKVWRTIDGAAGLPTEAPKTALELEVLVRGVFEPRRFLDLLQHFIVFEEDTDSDRLHKIIAGYHQFHAVNAAVEETVRASGMADENLLRQDLGAYWAGRMHGGKPGDRRAGVVWHTQGSGKSFSMLFYAARIVRHPAMKNPTLLVLTDRNDLDDQLFGQFQRCHELLRQMPAQAEGRLRQRLTEALRTLDRQAGELAAWNAELEARVAEDVSKIERLGRLQRFFSPAVADLLLSGDAEDPLKPRRREIVVIFLDLRGYTEFTEAHGPEEVMRVLSEFHEAMGRLIVKYGGTLERFTGDGMMVFFNDPIVIFDPSLRAAKMALEMQQAMALLQSCWLKRGYGLSMGIGIAKGIATIGGIGFEMRKDYGAIGSVTNLAARLCSEAKGGQVLMSEPVALDIQDDMVVNSIGERTLKGFHQPVGCYEFVM